MMLKNVWENQACFVIVVLILEWKISGSALPGTCINLDGNPTCYTKEENPYRNYGSRTAYPAISEDFTKTYPLEGCTPKVFYLLSRHATRYPDKEYIEYINKHLPSLKERIIDSFEKGNAKLCKNDIDYLKKWSPTMEQKNENMLSRTGGIEAMELGERLRQRFPRILGMKYSPERFVIEYTSRIRTRHTAENFTKGLLSELDYESVDFNTKTNDAILQFHKDCKIMRKKCDDPTFNTKEIEKFTNGTLMKRVISSVSKRIGFNVSSEDVKHMYVACTFGYALNISDAWCSLLSKDDLKVMEYNGDIEDYYTRAYGNEVNYKQACPLVKYIVELFKSYELTKREKVVLHFSHAGAIIRAFSALGLFQDNNPLTAEDFCALNNRKWRTSVAAPFNANIILVLYDCKGDLKLITLHNEKPIIIDGCDDKLCSLKKFYEKYNPIADKCDLKQICDTCKVK